MVSDSSGDISNEMKPRAARVKSGWAAAVLLTGSAFANAHIRAHALEGQLFRSVLEKSLQTHRIRTDVLIEREAYREAAVILKRSNENLRRTIQNFGRDTEGPWRAEQKLAAVAAWFALG
jgi:hypothetical protein